jgi:hypothetical protein
MAELLVTADDITVLGGPSSVTIDLDFGPQGQRGSQIFTGSGQPNNPTNPISDQSLEIFDLYINTLVGDSEYLYMYQYINKNGIDTWEPIVKLVPNIHSKNTEKVFVDGSTTINVKLMDIVSGTLVSSLEATNFNVQYSINNLGNPVSSTISLGAVAIIGGFRSLPITITAVEYDGTSWANLDGTRVVNLLITVV